MGIVSAGYRLTDLRLDEIGPGMPQVGRSLAA